MSRLSETRQRDPQSAAGSGPVIQLLTVALAGVACTFSIVASAVLPERFIMDNLHIIWVMNSSVAFAEDEGSYRNIGTFYEALRLNEQPGLVGILTLLLFTTAIFVAAGWSGIARFGLGGMALLLISFMCATVYLAQYTKECMPLMLVLLILVAPRHVLSELVFVILAVLYAIWFRPYWALIAGLYLLWRFVLLRRRRPATLILTLIVVYVVLQVSFSAVLGMGLTDNRASVNETRADEEVGSLITDPLPAHPLLMVPNAMLLLLSLVVPVPLLLKGSVFHLLSGLMIAFVWLSTLPQIVRGPLVEKPVAGTASPAPPGGARALRRARASALLVAVLSVQAIFEPDFGSYLKHLSPLMPLFVALVPWRQDLFVRDTRAVSHLTSVT